MKPIETLEQLMHEDVTERTKLYGEFEKVLENIESGFVKPMNGDAVGKLLSRLSYPEIYWFIMERLHKS